VTAAADCPWQEDRRARRFARPEAPRRAASPFTGWKDFAFSGKVKPRSDGIRAGAFSCQFLRQRLRFHTVRVLTDIEDICDVNVFFKDSVNDFVEFPNQ
jgi:hypothetical protein